MTIKEKMKPTFRVSLRATQAKGNSQSNVSKHTIYVLESKYCPNPKFINQKSLPVLKIHQSTASILNVESKLIRNRSDDDPNYTNQLKNIYQNQIMKEPKNLLCMN